MGIRVNAIAPGPVDTAMAKVAHSAAIRADYHDSIPLGRYGTPEEIAAGIGFCAATLPATSTANAWRSMAALTPWASACQLAPRSRQVPD